jgi:hypothetical protein
MLVRQEIINALHDMPETVSFMEIKETIEIIGANRRAMEDVRAGRTYTTEDAKKRIRELSKRA